MVQQTCKKVEQETNSQISIINTSHTPTLQLLYIPTDLAVIIEDLMKTTSKKTESLQISVLISCGKEDVSIRIQPTASTPFSQLYSSTTTTTKTTPPSTPVSLSVAMTTKVMASYWGGSLDQVQMGSLVHSYLHLPRTSEMCRERIPPMMETVPALC